MLVKVIDNFLTPSYANAIELDALNNLRYKYTRKTSYTSDLPDLITNFITSEKLYSDENVYDSGQMVCPIVIKGQTPEQYENKEYLANLKGFMSTCKDSFSDTVTLNQISRIKFNILTQRTDTPEFHYNIPHKDENKDNYFTVLYYVNDSDGDTYFFDKIYDGTVPDKLNVVRKISPKKNRAVLFDSRIFHASSNPRLNQERIVINLVFTGSRVV